MEFLVNEIAIILKELEYRECSSPYIQAAILHGYNERLISYGCKYNTIYDTVSKYTMIYHPEKHPNGLIIETLFQKSAGSVDSKFPYIVQNIKERYSARTIMILDGGGYRKGAEIWLRNQVDEKLIAVFTLEQFKQYAKENI